MKMSDTDNSGKEQKVTKGARMDRGEARVCSGGSELVLKKISVDAL